MVIWVEDAQPCSIIECLERNFLNVQLPKYVFERMGGGGGLDLFVGRYEGSVVIRALVTFVQTIMLRKPL